MSDRLTREFRVQLMSTMDSIVRKSVFEIMKIFENSLHDHQIDLAQKGEEIAQLKVKLQTAQVKLRESDRGGDTGAEMNTTKVNKTQREPQGALKKSGQTSDVPEIDFEVPDDWCAPLGCETVTKQDISVCPSIRLRQLSIPLWHIPVIKQEMVNRDIDSNQPIKGCRRSKRGSSLKEGQKHTQDGSLQCDQRTQRPTVRNDMKILLQDIKLDYTDLTGRPTTGLRRREMPLRGKRQEKTMKSKRGERQIAATESKSTNQDMVENDGEKRYSCKFCNKVFDTEFGQRVHARSHKTCRGCKKEFRFPSALKSHKEYCGKLQKLFAKKEQSTDPPKAQSCDEKKPSSPSKKLVLKKECKPSASNKSESSIQKDRSTKKHSCIHCNKVFYSRCKMKEHLRVHTGEKPFACSMCPKKFRINQSLKKHTMRIHKDQVSSSKTNEDLAWTKPLEEIEDNQEDLISSSKGTSRANNHNNVKRESSRVKRKIPGWQTMGTRCTNGYMCLVCKMQVRNKYKLTEHFHTHKGEMPKGECEKKVPPQMRYNKHTSYQEPCGALP